MTTPAEGAFALLNEDGEIVVKLSDGWSLRSGSETFVSGDYVRLCAPDGEEVIYWHHDEWERDPQLVMGAIMNSAAGLVTDAEQAAVLNRTKPHA